MTDTLAGGNGNGGTAVLDSPDYHPGSFKVGDVVRISDNSPFKAHIGAQGKIIRIDRDLILPIIVYLDIWEKDDPVENVGRLGVPVCASEIEKVGK